MKINTSVFLLKQEYSSIDDAFVDKTNVLEGNGCRIYITSRACNLPAWSGVVQKFLPEGKGRNILQSASSGAIIALKVKDRVMALSFASGRYNLDQNKMEDRFGLKTCLNMQTSDKFRNLKIQSLEVNGVQKLESRSSWSEMNDFSIYIENEMIKSVTGQVDDEWFGKNVSGFDSLSIKIDFENCDINAVCEKLLDAYYSDDYKRQYDFIDKIFPVNKKSVLKKLDEELFQKIRNHDENVWMCIPDFLDWENVEYIKYLDDEEEDDVRIEKFYEVIDGNENKTIDFLKKSYIKCYSSEGKCLYKQNAYYCSTAEVHLENVSYILNNAKWYSISTDFEKELDLLDEDIRNNSEIYSLVGLPACTCDKEEDYNNECALSPDFDLWDQQLVNRIEVCDLWSKRKEFIHVKKYSSSAVLSHLFLQGLVSATRLCQSKNFRQKVEQKGMKENLFTSGKMFASVDTFHAKDYSVKFAIISKDVQKFRLPRFSLISYRQTKRNIEDMGYSVGIIKIQKEKPVE